MHPLGVKREHSSNPGMHAANSFDRRNSPSVTTFEPIASCIETASQMQRSCTARKVGSSISPSAVLAKMPDAPAQHVGQVIARRADGGHTDSHLED